ncbi:hypothetical protein KC640_00595 [Candidatus Dojkabacteria bacterium]|uniref:Uncharacterized protein n=1 Tax=Candidatus Dojkabacteria bacterium TaxID=2099670 RepID=A0A955KYM2_9BACT|nr:hypothetical protein [Candidatus Dojkabacteria bacterium]
MQSATMQDIKRRGSNALSKDEPTYLVVNSRVDFVALPIGQYEMFVAIEEELADIKAALASEGEETVPLAQVLKEVGDVKQD